MIDLESIRNYYASMPDEMLLQLAREDRDGLTDEALIILKQESRARGLSMFAFEAKIEAEIEEELTSIEGFYNTPSSADNSMMGLSYQEMMYQNKEQELITSKENFLSKLSREELKELIKKSNNSMQKNGAIMAIGLAATIVTLVIATESGGTYVVAWGAIFFGGIGFFRAFEAKNTYQATLKNIDERKEELTDN